MATIGVPFEFPASQHGDALADQVGSAVEPIVDLRTGAVRAAEVLLRPRAHQTLAAWRGATAAALQDALPFHALRIAADLLRQEPIDVHVNVTTLDLGDRSFAARVRDVVDRPLLSRLVLEVTEEFPWDDGGAVARTALDLRTDGVKMALDDFGEGWSNLDALRTLRPEVLKVTTAVVRPEDAGSLAPVLVDLARGFGARCVLERIEDRRTAAWARRCGFDLGQGWLWPAAPPS